MIPATRVNNNDAQQPEKTVRQPRELAADELRFHAKIDRKFASTRELHGAEDFVGQARALAALELGLGVLGTGYNIFVSGLTGAEKLEALRSWVTQRAADAPTPGDWVYVHNFTHADAPRAICLKAGQGDRLREMMHQLIKTLTEELPKAFREEAFDKEKLLLTEKYSSRAQELNAQFAALARERGFVVQTGPRGNIYFRPVLNGRLLQRPQDFAELPEDQQQELERRQQELAVEMERLAHKQHDIMHEMEKDIRLVERRFCESVLSPILHRIAEDFTNDEVAAYLADIKEHVLNNLDDFKEAPPSAVGLPFIPAPRERDPFLEYDVNVVVDNSKTTGAPILVESAPTYLKLVRHHRASGGPLRSSGHQFHADQVRLFSARARGLFNL